MDSVPVFPVEQMTRREEAPLSLLSVGLTLG